MLELWHRALLILGAVKFDSFKALEVTSSHIN